MFPGLNKLVRSDIFNKFNLHNKTNKCTYAECVLSSTVLQEHVCHHHDHHQGNLQEYKQSVKMF